MNSKNKTSTVGRPQKGCYMTAPKSTLLYKAFPYKGKYTVYGLASSAAPEIIHYVGVTGRALHHRYNDHIATAKLKRSRKEKWIQSVLDDGYQLILITLEDGILTLEEAYEKEMYYIAMLDQCHPLTNMCKGGKGTLGLKHTPETKRKQSIANTGKKRKRNTTARWSPFRSFWRSL